MLHASGWWSGDMSNSAATFVRAKILTPLPPPGRRQWKLIATWQDAVLTALSLYLIWLFGWPALKFLVIDAVWTGSSRADCLAENLGRPVGACWPFIAAKFSQFVYGFYPES